MWQAFRLFAKYLHENFSVYSMWLHCPLAALYSVRSSQFWRICWRHFPFRSTGFQSSTPSWWSSFWLVWSAWFWWGPFARTTLDTAVRRTWMTWWEGGEGAGGNGAFVCKLIYQLYIGTNIYMCSTTTSQSYTCTSIFSLHSTYTTCSYNRNCLYQYACIYSYFISLHVCTLYVWMRRHDPLFFLPPGTWPGWWVWLETGSWGCVPHPLCSYPLH